MSAYDPTLPHPRMGFEGVTLVRINAIQANGDSYSTNSATSGIPNVTKILESGVSSTSSSIRGGVFLHGGSVTIASGSESYNSRGFIEDAIIYRSILFVKYNNGEIWAENQTRLDEFNSILLEKQKTWDDVKNEIPTSQTTRHGILFKDGTVQVNGFTNNNTTLIENMSDVKQIRIIGSVDIIALKNDGKLYEKGDLPLNAIYSLIGKVKKLNTNPSFDAYALSEDGVIYYVSNLQAENIESRLLIPESLNQGITDFWLSAAYQVFKKEDGTYLFYGSDQSRQDALNDFMQTGIIDLVEMDTYYDIEGTTNVDGVPTQCQVDFLHHETGRLITRKDSSPVDGSYSARMPRQWTPYILAKAGDGQRPMVHGPIQPPSGV